MEHELLASDTRDVDSRCRWPSMAPGTDQADIGELWLHRRLDGRLSLLQADRFTIMTAEFVYRINRWDPEVVIPSECYRPGTEVTFDGVGERVVYRILAFDDRAKLWLLGRIRLEEDGRPRGPERPSGPPPAGGVGGGL